MSSARVSVSVETWRDISSPDVASAVIERVLAEGEGFAFDRMGHEEPLKRRFRPEDAATLWAENTSTRDSLEVGWFIAEKKTQPHGSMMAHWQRKPRGLWLNWISLWADEEYFRTAEKIQRVLDLMAELSHFVGSGYGLGHHDAERKAKGWVDEILPGGRKAKTTITLKSQEGLIDLWWANLFGPPYVDLFGEERIQNCPAREVRKIGAKAYLVLTAPTPFDWSLQEARELQERAKRHLGLEAFFDRDNPSRKPSAPVWPPE